MSSPPTETPAPGETVTLPSPAENHHSVPDAVADSTCLPRWDHAGSIFTMGYTAFGPKASRFPRVVAVVALPSSWRLSNIPGCGWAPSGHLSSVRGHLGCSCLPAAKRTGLGGRSPLGLSEVRADVFGGISVDVDVNRAEEACFVPGEALPAAWLAKGS